MSDVLNRKATKEFIKRMAAKHRPGWEFTQVKEHAIDALALKLKSIIIQQVRILPSVGKTIDFPDL